MPHSSDPKLIVRFTADGDPLRQTADHGGEKKRKRKNILGNYTQELSSRLRT